MIAAVLCLLALFGAFVAYHGWQQAQWSAERARLTNALMAREPAEFIAMERQRISPKPKVRDDDDNHLLEPIGW